MQLKSAIVSIIKYWRQGYKRGLGLGTLVFAFMYICFIF